MYKVLKYGSTTLLFIVIPFISFFLGDFILPEQPDHLSFIEYIILSTIFGSISLLTFILVIVVIYYIFDLTSELLDDYFQFEQISEKMSNNKTDDKLLKEFRKAIDNNDHKAADIIAEKIILQNKK